MIGNNRERGRAPRRQQQVLKGTMLEKHRILLTLCYIAFFVVSALLMVRVGGVVAYDTSFVRTYVNITQALPIIDSVKINGGAAINLSEGTIKIITCNASIRDYNGLGDFSQVNATFFRNNGTAGTGFGALGAQDNNTRYFDYNCTYNGTYAAWTYAWVCQVNVTYYAYNGTWNCTVWANNTLNSPVNGTNLSWIYPLYAINVTDVVNYGNLSVFDTSLVQTVNVTNWGNIEINLTVYGFGNTSNTSGGGRAFLCPVGTNISIDNERYTVNDSTYAWSDMTALTSGPKMLNNLTLAKQMTDQEVWNTTYWRLYVPPNPFGLCNGTIVYEAIAAR
jgi:hypothetical protein